MRKFYSEGAKFKLKCVGCGSVEERDAEQCKEQPFCERCYMPMTLEEVTVNRAERLRATQGGKI